MYVKDRGIDYNRAVIFHVKMTFIVDSPSYLYSNIMMNPRSMVFLTIKSLESQIVKHNLISQSVLNLHTKKSSLKGCREFLHKSLLAGT